MTIKLDQSIKLRRNMGFILLLPLKQVLQNWQKASCKRMLTNCSINLRTTELQDTAKSFSALANQVLREAEQDRQS
ncbi:hypothetical protein Lal_00012325 [Lupinus albus]|nr:hypothetical protein Lal_00012325 [Lupinus albus]